MSCRRLRPRTTCWRRARSFSATSVPKPYTRNVPVSSIHEFLIGDRLVETVVEPKYLGALPCRESLMRRGAWPGVGHLQPQRHKGLVAARVDLERLHAAVQVTAQGLGCDRQGAFECIPEFLLRFDGEWIRGGEVNVAGVALASVVQCHEDAALHTQRATQLWGCRNGMQQYVHGLAELAFAGWSLRNPGGYVRQQARH